MLRAVTNKSGRDHLTNKQLYGSIPKISKSIRMQRLDLPDTVGEAKMNWQAI